jgi:hypothetical protein
MRLPRFVALLLFPVLVLAGCGGSVAPSGASSSVDGGSEATTGGASCSILASSYDQTCSQDSDCVLVPPGGDTCDPCSAGTGCLFCDIASVNAAASAKYLSDLAAALQPYQGQSQYFGCVTGGCPVGLTAVCHQGLCTTSAGPVCTP